MSEHPWRLLALPPVGEQVLAAFVDGANVALLPLSSRTQDAVVAAAADAEIVLGDWSGQLRIDETVLAAAPSLAFIQQPSAGVETVDLEAATARGIPVANTGSANTVAVAEWCLLAAMALLRSLLAGDAAVRVDRWPQLDLPVRELAGSRVGILGLGRIGVACAQRFTAMGAVVSYWSRTPKPALPWPYLELSEIVAASDVLVSLLPAAPQTRGLLSADMLGRLQPSAVLVSAGRGEVLDEAALAEALTAGRLAGAALDVYTVEPLPGESPLRGAPRLLLSPHVAGATAQARLGILHAVRANLRAATTGSPVNDLVNDVAALIRRR